MWWVLGIFGLFTPSVVFAWALCRIGARADRLMDEHQMAMEYHAARVAGEARRVQQVRPLSRRGTGMARWLDVQ